MSDGIVELPDVEGPILTYMNRQGSISVIILNATTGTVNGEAVLVSDQPLNAGLRTTIAYDYSTGLLYVANDGTLRSRPIADPSQDYTGESKRNMSLVYSHKCMNQKCIADLNLLEMCSGPHQMYVNFVFSYIRCRYLGSWAIYGILFLAPGFVCLFSIQSPISMDPIVEKPMVLSK